MHWHDFQAITLGLTRQSVSGQNLRTSWSCQSWEFEHRAFSCRIFGCSERVMIKERWWLSRATCCLPLQRVDVFFVFFYLIWKDSHFRATGGKRLLGRCVLWWFHLCFQWRPCLWLVGPLTEQKQDNSTVFILVTIKASFAASTELVSCWKSSFCRVYVSWLMFFSKKVCLHFKRERVYAGITTCVGQAVLWNTSVSQHRILLPDSHLMLCVCAHNLPGSYIHLDWLCVCACVWEGD